MVGLPQNLIARSTSTSPEPPGTVRHVSAGPESASIDPTTAAHLAMEQQPNAAARLLLPHLPTSTPRTRYVWVNEMSCGSTTAADFECHPHATITHLVQS